MAVNIEREVTITAGQLKFHFIKFKAATSTAATTAAATVPTTLKEPMAAFGSTQTTLAGGVYRFLPVNISNSSTSIGKIITIDVPTSNASAGFVCIIGR